MLSGQTLQAKELNVPLEMQEHSQWCWAAVSSSLLHYFGQRGVSQCAIAEFARKKTTYRNFGPADCCVDPTQGCNQWNYLFSADGSVEHILEHFGKVLSKTLPKAYSQAEADQQLNTLLVPFIIRWQWSHGSGHFVLARGLTGDALHYMNPWYGEGYKIAKHSWVVKGGNHTWMHTLQPLVSCNCNSVRVCCPGCQMQNKGAACDDSDLCTLGDTCQGGACVGQVKGCGQPGQCHLGGSCSKLFGACVYPNRPDGTACDDQDICTVDDACEDGACSGTPRKCQPRDACHVAGTCDPHTGECSNPPIIEGAPCPGGACRSGRCVIPADASPLPDSGEGKTPPVEPGSCSAAPGGCGAWWWGILLLLIMRQRRI